MTREVGRGAVLVVLAALAASVGVATSSAQNVVVIVADDHGADLGCYGNPAIRTPHLDALAADGVAFDRAFATTASCSASRSVLLTGLFNHANGQYGHEHAHHRFRTRDAVRSLPVRFEAAGYRTARIGKYHVGPEAVYRFGTALRGNARSPVAMARATRAFVTADDPRPFLLYFCTSDPHRGGGRIDDAPGRPDAFGNRPEPRPGVPATRYALDDVIVPAWLPDTRACRAELAQYYRSVTRVDAGVGALVDVLRDADVLDDTLIVYTSDHGAAFAGGKTTAYEPGLRVPLIVRDPRHRDRGTRRSQLVSLVDLTPTLLAWAGIEVAANELHGRSFLPVLRDADAAGADRVFASHTFHEITMYYPMRVVREGRFKLIWNVAWQLPFPFATDLWASSTWQDAFARGRDARYGVRTVDAYLQRAEFELFDLNADPDEATNLADDPEHVATLTRLQDELRTFQQRTRDPWRIQWRYRAAARDASNGRGR